MDLQGRAAHHRLHSECTWLNNSVLFYLFMIFFTHQCNRPDNEESEVWQVWKKKKKKNSSTFEGKMNEWKKLLLQRLCTVSAVEGVCEQKILEQRMPQQLQNSAPDQGYKMYSTEIKKKKKMKQLHYLQPGQCCRRDLNRQTVFSFCGSNVMKIEIWHFVMSWSSSRVYLFVFSVYKPKKTDTFLLQLFKHADQNSLF